LKKTQESHLFSWIKYNLIGAGIGICCGIILSLFVAETIFYLWRPTWLYNYHLGPILSGIFLWLPYALGLGIAQWIKMNRWNMSTRGWILATVLGWSLFGIGFNYATDFVVRESSPAIWQILTVHAVVLLSGGMCIGLFQTIAAHKILPKPGLWILTNMLGVFALVAITLLLIGLPFALKSYIIKFLDAIGLGILVGVRDLLLLGFLIISVPLVATLTLFIPTGKLLLKYSTPSLESQDRIHNKINGKLLP
jgi:hypothetical protein